MNKTSKTYKPHNAPNNLSLNTEFCEIYFLKSFTAQRLVLENICGLSVKALRCLSLFMALTLTLYGFCNCD